MSRAQESLETATTENKALMNDIKAKNRDLKHFALTSMILKIELMLCNMGIGKHSRLQRSFHKWNAYVQEKSNETRKIERILRKFCHDKYFSAAFHHWKDLTSRISQVEEKRKKALLHVISRARLLRERRLQKCWSMWKNQTLRVSHSLYNESRDDMKTRLAKLEKEQDEAKMKFLADQELQNSKIAFLQASLNRSVQERMRNAISSLTSQYVRSHLDMKRFGFERWNNFVVQEVKAQRKRSRLTMAMWQRGKNVTEDLLLVALTKWKRFVRHCKEEDRKRKLLCRLKARTNIHLESSYFSKWKKWTKDRLGARQLGHLRKEKFCHGLKIIWYVIRRRQDISLRRAFRIWLCRTRDLHMAKRYAIVLVQSLRDWREAALRDAFEAWRDVMRFFRTQDLLSQLAKTTVELDNRVARTDSRLPSSPIKPAPTTPVRKDEYEEEEEEEFFDDGGFDTVEEYDTNSMR